jgi:hypothetical protein
LGGFLLFSGSAYIETLARWARAVYPFDFPPMMVDQWTFLLYFVWLRNRSMVHTVESKIPPGRPVVGVSCPTSEIFECYRMCTSEKGDTSEIVASLNTLTHIATYIRGK